MMKRLSRNCSLAVLVDRLADARTVYDDVALCQVKAERRMPDDETLRRVIRVDRAAYRDPLIARHDRPLMLCVPLCQATLIPCIHRRLPCALLRTELVQCSRVRWKLMTPTKGW
jgi:hypothetical protein